MTREDLRDDARLVFNTAEGQNVLDDLKARYCINTTTFSVDPTETAYREGQRTVILYIMNLIEESTPQELQEEGE